MPGKNQRMGDLPHPVCEMPHFVRNSRVFIIPDFQLKIKELYRQRFRLIYWPMDCRM
jgi:hypothetical protein